MSSRRRRFIPWRTIERNVALPLEIMGMSAAERKAAHRATLDLVNLTGFEKKYPWQLSGGMQQRASIARALAFDADLLLMDEPFGALDEIVRDHLNKQLLELWARTNKTICFVTHSIPEAVYLSTRIVVMSPRPGRVTDVIESTLPRERPLDIRETPEFLEIAARVRDGLRQGTAMRIEAALEGVRVERFDESEMTPPPPLTPTRKGEGTARGLCLVLIVDRLVMQGAGSSPSPLWGGVGVGVAPSPLGAGTDVLLVTVSGRLSWGAAALPPPCGEG